MDIDFIKDLARKYSNVCEFKSDFPHDWNSVNDGYIEGFKTAERLVNENLTIPIVIVPKKGTLCKCGKEYLIYNDREGLNVCTLCGKSELA